MFLAALAQWQPLLSAILPQDLFGLTLSFPPVLTFLPNKIRRMVLLYNSPIASADSFVPAKSGFQLFS
jgi:hypothetical protein